MKKVMLMMLCMLMVLAAAIPVCATEWGSEDISIQPRLNNVDDCETSFAINASGVAEVVVHYTGNSSTFTEVTVETYIQKKTLGLFWTKVNIGESNNTWVDSSTGLSGTFVHTVQLEDTGNYRAVFQITFSGTGGADDVIEKTITCSYE